MVCVLGVTLSDVLGIALSNVLVERIRELRYENALPLRSGVLVGAHGETV